MNILKSVLAHCAEHYDFTLSQSGVIDVSRTITVEGSPQRVSELSVFTTGALVLDYFSNFFLNSTAGKEQFSISYVAHVTLFGLAHAFFFDCTYFDMYKL